MDVYMHGKVVLVYLYHAKYYKYGLKNLTHLVFTTIRQFLIFFVLFLLQNVYQQLVLWCTNVLSTVGPVQYGDLGVNQICFDYQGVLIIFQVFPAFI